MGQKFVTVKLKKLLVFHPALAPYRVDFFNALGLAFDATFYFSNANAKDQIFDQQQLRSLCNFRFRLLDKGMEFGGRSFRTGIHSLLNKHRPDIVICSEYSQITLMIILLKLAFRQKFRLYTISDDSVDLSAKRSGVRKWLRDKVSHYIDGVILPGRSVCNWYHQHVNNKTRLFPLPIVHENRSFRAKLEEVFPTVVSQWEENKLDDKRIFLFVGRLVKIKNAGFLIQAFHSALPEMPGAVLYIIGDGDENETLRDQAKDLELGQNCIFLGRLDGQALYAWFRMAHCLVLPSYQEPYGAVVNEALLAGCKVLCSKLAGASELITVENGAIFDPHDMKALSDLLISQYHSIEPGKQKLKLRPDLMPFQLSNKLKPLISFLEFQSPIHSF